VICLSIIMQILQFYIYLQSNHHCSIIHKIRPVIWMSLWLRYDLSGQTLACSRNNTVNIIQWDGLKKISSVTQRSNALIQSNC
jgi:hypothetical protein